MKYRPLPIEKKLAALDTGAKLKAIGPLMVETMSTQGFQLVTGLLRELDRATLAGLRGGLYAARPDLATGRLQVIDDIRRTLRSYLPEPERAKVDWFDQESEGFIEDPSVPDDDNG
jgi:hypothetical protein